jgi:hypothetical protein
VLSGPGVTTAVAGAVESFVVTLYDLGNNRLTVGGDTLLVTISPNQHSIEVFDNNDGSYLVKYRITLAGLFALQVTVNQDN